MAQIEHLEQKNLFTYSLKVLGIGSALKSMWRASLAHGARAAFVGDICVAEQEISEALGIKCDLVGTLLVGYDTIQQCPRARATFDVHNKEHVSWHPGRRIQRPTSLSPRSTLQAIPGFPQPPAVKDAAPIS